MMFFLRRKQERPRLLGCLHTVCTPCLNQVIILVCFITRVFLLCFAFVFADVHSLSILSSRFLGIVLANSKLPATRIFFDDKNVNTLNCLVCLSLENKRALFLGGRLHKKWHPVSSLQQSRLFNIFFYLKPLEMKNLTFLCLQIHLCERLIRIHRSASKDTKTQV